MGHPVKLPFRNFLLVNLISSQTSSQNFLIESIPRLDAGDASLVVEGSEGETQLSEGRVVGVRAPPDCLPRFKLLQSLSFTVTSIGYRVTVTQ